MLVFGEPVFFLKPRTETPTGPSTGPKKGKGKGRGKGKGKGLGAGNGKSFGQNPEAVYVAQPSLAPASGYGYDYGNSYGS